VAVGAEVDVAVDVEAQLLRGMMVVQQRRRPMLRLQLQPMQRQQQQE
jgi:hypothetical protein